MRGVGGGEIAESGQGHVLASASLGIAGGGAGAGLRDAIAVGEGLNGFIGERGGIGRAENGIGGAEKGDGADRTGGLIDNVCLFLGANAGCGEDSKQQCTFHGEWFSFYHKSIAIYWRKRT